MELETLFTRLGFGKNAHKVYAVLSKQKKPLLISHLAREAKIERPEAYRNIKKLLARGFIKKIYHGKRVLYAAENFEKVRAAFKADVKSTDALASTLPKQKVLPEHVVYFKGFKGIREVFDDVILRTPRGSTFYRYTSERDLAAVNKYLSPKYRAIRDKKKLEREVISNPLSGSLKRARLERFIKYIPKEVDVFDHNIIEIIYADSLAFINLNTEEAFIIRDKSLADFQKVIFSQLYKKLK